MLVSVDFNLSGSLVPYFAGHWPSDLGWELHMKAAAGRKRERRKWGEWDLFVYTPNAFLPLVMINGFWLSSSDHPKEPLIAKIAGCARQDKFKKNKKWQACLDSNACTDRLGQIQPESKDTVLHIHFYIHTDISTHRPERWSGVFRTRASLVYSEALCFSWTLNALTGGNTKRFTSLSPCCSSQQWR